VLIIPVIDAATHDYDSVEGGVIEIKIIVVAGNSLKGKKGRRR
jgi:hypothetical protein